MSTKQESRSTSRPGSRQHSFSKSRPSRPSSHQSYRKPNYEQPSIVIESSNEQSSESEGSLKSESESESEAAPPRPRNVKSKEKRSSRSNEEKKEKDKPILEFSKPSYSLEAHTFACPCGGTLKSCWPENLELSRLVVSKIPVFGEPNKVNELADSISALPVELHFKLSAYCLSGNTDVQAEVMDIIAEMDMVDWRDYGPHDPHAQKILMEKVEEKMRNSQSRERPYIFALMGVSLGTGMSICELPSFTVILSRVYQ